MKTLKLNKADKFQGSLRSRTETLAATIKKGEGVLLQDFIDELGGNYSVIHSYLHKMKALIKLKSSGGLKPIMTVVNPKYNEEN